MRSAIASYITSAYLHNVSTLSTNTEDDVMKRHEAKATADAAKKLPVGFISQDVKKSHESSTPPPTPDTTSKPVKEEVPVGFIAEDVMKRHAH